MIKTIDFGQLYREHLARSGRVFKEPLKISAYY